MLKKLLKPFARKIFGIGDNLLLGTLVNKKRIRRNRVKFAGLLLCTLPVRKTLSLSAGSKDYYFELHDLLHVSGLNDHELVRVGGINDGGYIMADDFHRGGVAYSFGICDDVSWDRDMASRGYDVFMYDHTINGLPEDNPRFHFFRLGLSSSGKDTENLRTLKSLLEQNHHEDKRDMILKADVETAEWGFFENTDSETLSRFSQIAFEFHGMNGEFDSIDIPGFTKRIPEVLRKINKTHQLVHIHGLNNGYCISLGDKVFCNQIEVLYVLRDKYNFCHDYDVRLPLEIDAPCHTDRPDVCLGFWNKKIKSDDEFTSITIW